MTPHQRTLSKIAKTTNKFTIFLLFLLIFSGIYYERGGPAGGDICLYVFVCMGVSLLVWVYSVAILMVLQCLPNRD